MNWDAIGAIGELAGAIAVVLTLVYLSVQIRQNTSAMEAGRNVELANNYDRRARTRIELSMLVAGNPELAEINLKLDEGGWPDNLDALNALSPLERRRIASLSITQILHLESIFYQYGLGLLDESIHERSIVFANRMMPAWRALELPLDTLLGHIANNEGPGA